MMKWASSNQNQCHELCKGWGKSFTTFLSSWHCHASVWVAEVCEAQSMSYSTPVFYKSVVYGVWFILRHLVDVYPEPSHQCILAQGLAEEVRILDICFESSSMLPGLKMLEVFCKRFQEALKLFPFVSNACHRHLGCRVSRLLQYASLETTENFDGASCALQLKTQEIPRSSRSRGHPWNNLDEHPDDPLLLCRRTLAHQTSRLHSSQSKWPFSP